jgi:FtsH-binding integral membrane protein
MGLSMSTLFIAFTGTSIAIDLLRDRAAFIGLSLWGYTTKKDLSGFGTFLIMGVVGILVAMLINMFLQSTGPEPGDQRDRRAAVRGPHRL